MKEETVIQENPGKRNRKTFLTGRGILVSLSSATLGRTYIVNQENITIGRDSSCDICLDDPLVSKVHSRITVEDQRIFKIEDLGSTNGTYLNKKRLSRPTQMYYSDRVVIGSSIFRFFIEETLDKTM